MTSGDRPRRNDPLMRRILSGESDANIRFSDLRRLLLRLGFEERISGSHHVFGRTGIRESINVQPQGGEVKSYQVQQVRRIFEKYGIDEE